MEHLVDGAVLLGLGVVVPLAIGGWPRWLAAAAATGGALALAPGWAAGLLAVPGVVAAILAVRDAPPLDLVGLLAAAWTVVAAGALLASASGWGLLGHEEPFVRLTAVHFLFAGTGALVLAGASGSPLAVRATAAGPPVVAAGFLTGSAVPQVGGAALLAAGVFTTAAAQLREAIGVGALARRTLLVVSGMAVWAPMVLAVAWAAGQHWEVPALSVPDMARWHGAPNAVAFVLCGLLARRLPAGPSTRRLSTRAEVVA